jgi:purine-binding chemotaxis protein CheW
MIEAVAADERDYQVIVFGVGTEVYGVEIGLIHEIIRHQPITALPGTSAEVLGLLSLRGRILPVVSMRVVLGMDDVAPTAASRIVVVELDRGRVGLAVDAVSAVRRLPQGSIQPPPALGGAAPHLAGVTRVDDDLVVLLDLEAALARVDTDRPLA